MTTLTLTDFAEEHYKLKVRADLTDPKVTEACREVNTFWSGSEDRLERARDSRLGADRAINHEECLFYAMAVCLLKLALGCDASGHVRNAGHLIQEIARGQEGWPDDLSEYGIEIVEWQFSPLDTDECGATWEES